MGHSSQKAIIIGASIGGLAAAATLRQVGIDTEVYEQASELGTVGTGLSVMSNAVLALRSLGIDLGLGGGRRGEAIERAEIFTAKGRLLRAIPLKELGDRLGAPSVCIHHGDLQAAFLQVAGDAVRLGAVATGFDWDGDKVWVDFEDGRRARGDMLIGADGINSVIRRQLAGSGELRESGYVSWFATVPFAHPQLTKGFNGHYWGRGRRFGLHDLGGGRVYWWGTKNMPVEAARDWDGGKEEIVRAFRGWAPEVREAIKVTPQEAITALPARDRPFLELWGRGPVTLLGEAAHPMLTSLAQGGSIAIEDAVVLARTLEAATDRSVALRIYENRRRDRTKKMVEVSYRLSRIEQLANPFLCVLRNTYMRFDPAAQLSRLYEEVMTPPWSVDFPSKPDFSRPDIGSAHPSVETTSRAVSRYSD